MNKKDIAMIIMTIVLIGLIVASAVLYHKNQKLKILNIQNQTNMLWWTTVEVQEGNTVVVIKEIQNKTSKGKAVYPKQYLILKIGD